MQYKHMAEWKQIFSFLYLDTVPMWDTTYQTEIMNTRNGLQGQSFFFFGCERKKNFFCEWQIFGHAYRSVYTTPAEL